MDFKVGEIVTRLSYENDIVFRIASLSHKEAILHGEEIRLVADSPVDDLVRLENRELEKRRKKGKDREEFSYRLFRQDYLLMKEKREYQSTDGYQHINFFQLTARVLHVDGDQTLIKNEEVEKRRKKEKDREEFSYCLFRQDYLLMKEKREYQSTDGYQHINFFQLPARVLHVDGDQTYLKKCIELYKRVGLQVHGVHMDEKEMPFQIGALINKIQPHIIVITGHDSFSKHKGLKSDLRAYRHSKYFAETVREARQIVPDVDQLIIFAGACQSHFESLIRAGANFASSPSRINIHALDPVYIVAK